MSWAKKSPKKAPGTIFETQGRGQYPPQMASLRNESLRTLWRVDSPPFVKRFTRLPPRMKVSIESSVLKRHRANRF
jgi:hypothetical protein